MRNADKICEQKETKKCAKEPIPFKIKCPKHGVQNLRATIGGKCYCEKCQIEWKGDKQ